ncbi:MAG: ACP S-malonyltransferase [Desulfobacterales bacterium]
MNKTVFLFPGQGSQTVGMGKDLHDEFDFVRELFDMAEEITQNHIRELCFKGPMEVLTRTVNLQPAIVTVSLAFLSAVEKEGIFPEMAAGHSLGEYGALCSAKIISAEDTIRAVDIRGRLMDREANRYQGAMSAIIGLPVEAVQEIVDQTAGEGTVSVANHNTQNQIVITGAPGPVKNVSEIATRKGAKAIPLKVSGAWHSELIKGAEEELRRSLEQLSFQKPMLPVIHNYTADISPSDPDQIRKIMVMQLCHPVKWYDCVCKINDLGIVNYVEIGPGKVLTGLARKILPKNTSARFFNVNDLNTLESFFKNIS